ncbi:MAG: hypothetical protein JWM98_986 [Thermoleophilia bacterium]|nr:hypothetical protein [Thermoleophilia bacterium]
MTLPPVSAVRPLAALPARLLGDPGGPGAITPPGLDELIAVARANAAGRWELDRDIATARNAHRTNTFGQLRAALAGPFDWLECDVQRHGDTPVAAHGTHDAGALPLREWLRACAAGHRGVKLDVKDGRSLRRVVQLLREVDIPDRRIIFNLAPADRGHGRRHTSVHDALRVREAFPGAIINLDPGDAPYTPASIARIVAIARRVGGRIMFPLEAQHVTRDAVRALRRVGRVAVWNDPLRSDPGDLGAATARLRRLGVNGMIDLRRPEIGARR